MKTFFDMLGFMISKKKALLAIALIFSTAAMSLMMYEKNLSATIDGSYDNVPEGVTTYSYTIEGIDKNSVNDTSIRDEISYYKILKNGRSFSYNTYLNTSATLPRLKNKGLAVNANEDGSAPEAGYKVRVLFVDKATIAGTKLEPLLEPCFDIATDYDKSVPAIFGTYWQGEGYNVGADRVTVKTTVNTYDLVPYGYTEHDTIVTVGREEVNLNDYIIIPLIEVDKCKFPDRQSELERWHKIYTIMINGYIKSDKSANTVQKELFEAVKNEGTSGKILIKSADFNSRYIFRDDLDGMLKTVSAAAIIAIIINGIVVLLYSFYNFNSNQKYFYIQMLLGNSKLVLAAANILIYVAYFACASGLGCVAALLMGKVLGTKVASFSSIIIAQAAISAVAAAMTLLRFMIYDAGKAHRRV
ncbi:MAG: hypothetical protein PUB67_00715 [Clostridiales bacterium]|nr:hypothetical protein [Clostridiales bacterium]